MTSRALLIMLLVTSFCGMARADVLHERFDLLKAPRDRDPYSQDFSFTVRKTGLIEIFVTMNREPNDNSKDPNLTAVLLHQPKGTILAQKKLGLNQLQYFEYPLDSPTLAKSNQFIVRVNNWQTKTPFRGEVSVRYPGTREDRANLVIESFDVRPNQCRIEYTVRNLGPGPVPYTAWAKQNGMQIGFFRNDKFWGGEALFAADPSGRLAHPGGYIEHDTALAISDRYVEKIRVLLDRDYKVPETDEQNEYFADLVCGYPDLIISRLHHDAQCNLLVDIENIALGNVSGKVYGKNMVAKLRIEANGTPLPDIPFSVADPERKLVAPQSKVTVNTGWKVPPSETRIQVTVDATRMQYERNDNNNVRTQQLSCQPAGTVPMMRMPLKQNL